MRRPRFGSLPEDVEYRDDGCQYHPRCLTCPFSRCVRHEIGTASEVLAFLNEPRNETIRALRAAGVPVEALTRDFGVSRRTVFRITSDSALSQSGKAVIRG